MPTLKLKKENEEKERIAANDKRFNHETHGAKNRNRKIPLLNSDSRLRTSILSTINCKLSNKGAKQNGQH
jgi:hypothetical protein